MSELAEDGVPVTVSCRVLKLARQPYYRWKRDPVADAEWLRARRMNVLFDGFKDPKYRPAPLLVEMVEAGYLGRKTGRGFFTYA